MGNFQLPDPRDLLSQIVKVNVYDPETKKFRKIQRYVKEDADYCKSIRTSSQDEKFAFFVCDLLRRGQGTIFGQKTEEKLHQLFTLSEVPDLDVRKIKFKGKGTSERMVNLLSKRCDLKKLNSLLSLVEKYRWGKGIAAFVVIGVKYMIMHEYDGFESYLKTANIEHENGFINDKLLSDNDGIKYVGPKVRDLALSSFLDSYLAVDQFIKVALLRTGMLSYMYEHRIRIKSMDDYWGLRKLCVELANSSRLKPYEFDRTLWHFVGKFCNPTFKKECKNCEVTLCLSHPSR